MAWFSEAYIADVRDVFAAFLGRCRVLHEGWLAFTQDGCEYRAVFPVGSLLRMPAREHAVGRGVGTLEYAVLLPDREALYRLDASRCLERALRAC